MSACLRIESNTVAARTVPLDVGLHKVGPSPDSSVFLLDHPGKDPLFLLQVKASSVVLEWLGTAPARLEAPTKRHSKTLSSGQAVLWNPRSTLTSGSHRFRLVNEDGETFQAAPPSGFLKKVGIPAAIVAISLPVLFGNLTLESGINRTEAVQEVTGTQDRTTAQWTQTTLMNALAGIGFVPTKLVLEDSVWVADFYVNSNSDKARIIELVSTLEPPVEARVQTDNASKTSAEVILGALKTDAQISTVRDGVVTILGVDIDSPDRDLIRNTLKKDVPGLKSVSFEGNETQRVDAVKASIAGRWLGKNPYVVLENGKILKPSEEIAPGVTLEDISEAAVLIKIGSTTREVEF